MIRNMVFSGLLMLLCASAFAAPRYPFPASPRSLEDWWTSAAQLPLTNPALGTLCFAWDADALTIRLSGAAPAGMVALQTLAGETRIAWANGDGKVVRNGTPRNATVVFSDDGAWHTAIRWPDLGLKPGSAGAAFPLSVGWGANSYPARWLPETPILVNALQWGALYLNADMPTDECAPTLTKPFIARFDPTGARAVLTISPEPIAGLIIPVEVTEQALDPAGAAPTATRVTTTAREAARIALAQPKGAAAVGVSLRAPLYQDLLPPNEYRALPSGGPLSAYSGAPDWNPPDDFDGYWARAREDLARTPANPRVTAVPERSTATGDLYRVELDSLGNVGIVCWYFVPKGVDVLGGAAPTRKYPAVQIMPGYGAEEPPFDRTSDGYITLSVNPRGHGPSGALYPLPADHLNWNINDPERYYYRGAYMDCVRAMQWLMSRPEVDVKRVGVEGSSQGGALALATAALDNRVAACSANVPFLCDFPTGVVLCTRGGLSGLRTRFEADTPEGAAVRRSLSYVDGSFMATRIHSPTLIAVGEMDRTCPPQGGAAAYNRLPKGVDRSLLTVPFRDHEVMPEWRTASEAWFRKYLKGSD